MVPLTRVGAREKSRGQEMKLVWTMSCQKLKGEFRIMWKKITEYK